MYVISYDHVTSDNEGHGAMLWMHRIQNGYPVAGHIIASTKNWDINGVIDEVPELAYFRDLLNEVSPTYAPVGGDYVEVPDEALAVLVPLYLKAAEAARRPPPGWISVRSKSGASMSDLLARLRLGRDLVKA